MTSFVNSEILGYSFWLDNKTLMSCPTFSDGKPDLENEIPVEDWECLDDLSEVQTKELDNIKKSFSINN